MPDQPPLSPTPPVMPRHVSEEAIFYVPAPTSTKWNRRTTSLSPIQMVEWREMTNCFKPPNLEVVCYKAIGYWNNVQGSRGLKSSLIVPEGSFHSIYDVNIDPAFRGNTGQSWKMPCKLQHHVRNLPDVEKACKIWESISYSCKDFQSSQDLPCCKFAEVWIETNILWKANGEGKTVLLDFSPDTELMDKSKDWNLANYSQVTALSFVPMAAAKDRHRLSLIQLLSCAPYQTALFRSPPVPGSAPQ